MGAFTDRHAVLRIAADRHEDHAKKLLSDTRAIVTSDRWWADTHLAIRRRQVCWAYLQRDFAAHAEGLAAEKQFGEAERRIRLLRRELKPILRRYAAKGKRYKYTRAIARNLLEVWLAP